MLHLQHQQTSLSNAGTNTIIVRRRRRRRITITRTKTRLSLVCLLLGSLFLSLFFLYMCTCSTTRTITGFTLIRPSFRRRIIIQRNPSLLQIQIQQQIQQQQLFRLSTMSLCSVFSSISTELLLDQQKQLQQQQQLEPIMVQDTTTSNELLNETTTTVHSKLFETISLHENNNNVNNDKVETDESNPTQRIRRSTKEKHLVLIGGGHAHVQVIKEMNEQNRFLLSSSSKTTNSTTINWKVTLIDCVQYSTYSGMIPGCIIGKYTIEQSQINLVQLAEWSSINFVHGTVVDINFQQQLIYTKQQMQQQQSVLTNTSSHDISTTIPYDILSIDIGSTSRDIYKIPGAIQYTIPTRPIYKLIETINKKQLIDVQRIQKQQQDHQQQQQQQQQQVEQQDDPIHIIIVGGGIAGIELALSITSRWKQSVTNNTKCTIIHSNNSIVPDLSYDSRLLLLQVLQESNISIVYNSQVVEITENTAIVQSTTKSSNSDNKSMSSINFNHCVWATGAGCHTLIRTIQQNQRQLDCDINGWIKVLSTLQTISYPNVFAAGDCSTMYVDTVEQEQEQDTDTIEQNSKTVLLQPKSIPKAGVYAVRSGPILIENIYKYMQLLNQADENKLEKENDDNPIARQHNMDNNSKNFDEEKENLNVNNTIDIQLVQYKPQDDFMKLVVCNNNKAIGFRYGIAFVGKWVLDMKDDIDTSFMNLFNASMLGPKPTAITAITAQTETQTRKMNDNNNNSHNMMIMTEQSKANTKKKNNSTITRTKQYDANLVDNVYQNYSLSISPKDAVTLLRQSQSQPDDEPVVEVQYQYAWAVLRRIATDTKFRIQILNEYYK